MNERRLRYLDPTARLIDVDAVKLDGIAQLAERERPTFASGAFTVYEVPNTLALKSFTLNGEPIGGPRTHYGHVQIPGLPKSHSQHMVWHQQLETYIEDLVAASEDITLPNLYAGVIDTLAARRIGKYGFSVVDQHMQNGHVPYGHRDILVVATTSTLRESLTRFAINP